MKPSVTRGLTRVPDEDLVALLRAIHRGRFTFPLRRSELMELGMNRLADHADSIVGLEERAVRAVITVVLAERRFVEERRAVDARAVDAREVDAREVDAREVDEARSLQEQDA